jgi:hypothetical protein
MMMMSDRNFVFYVGTNKGNWLWSKENRHPLFVSVRSLKNHKKLPEAKTNWACDSGGFTELSMYGKWVTTPTEYIHHLERFNYEIGSLDWAAPQDYMCEPQMLKKTNKTVEEHQHLTCQNYLVLTRLNPFLPIIPVLQGWLPDDYLRHAEMYATYNINLEEQMIVGVGSVCRRSKVDGIKQVFQQLAQDHLKLHGFGLKQDGIKVFGNSLFSSDSMAWSFTARAAGWRNEYLCGQKHENAKSCGDCHDWAMKWADKVVANNAN